MTYLERIEQRCENGIVDGTAFTVAFHDCPDDHFPYAIKPYYCSLNTERGAVNEECFRCWMREEGENEMDNVKNEAVNHPAHYTQGGIECIDAIEAATAGLTGAVAVCIGNVIKYVWRFHWKGGIEDLRKAKWYLERTIMIMEKQRNKEED